MTVDVLFFLTGIRNEGLQNSSGKHRRRENDSLVLYNRDDRTSTQEGKRRQMRSSPTNKKDRSPSRSSTPSSEDGGNEMVRIQQIGQTNLFPDSSSPVERKARRYKFAVREVERSEQQRKGKKPFYITLNGEGIPYGPGRPAWIAEVNKLAAWLDPSCTHIRKQTYEDMCVLKDRLNDNFEYSGDLNQDFLRGLLGKAVTRRRTDLISYIRRDGKQPLSFDAKIWKRLEKLASSKQRGDRTEHGRYANKCRRTLGRTGASGVNGVRQRLEQWYGRSPDPDEVAEEMKRDKGFGKKEMEECRNSNSQRQ